MLRVPIDTKTPSVPAENTRAMTQPKPASLTTLFRSMIHDAHDRAHQVEQLRQAIAGGTYQVPVALLAESLQRSMQR